MKKASGILMPISSLPSKYGIGCFSKTAYDFVDWLVAAGQKYWQILPLGPTGFGDSPYQSFSTFAGNPYMISLEELIDEGVLNKEECDDADFGKQSDDIDYEKLYFNRYPVLKRAYKKSNILENKDYVKFVNDNKWWLEDYALFMAVKEHFNGKPWTMWDKDIMLKNEDAIEFYSKKLEEEVVFWQYIQYKFYEQWMKLKNYANSKGISIIGDIPIYVAMDSADVWSNVQLFQVDENHRPIAVAGCPPDGFAAGGQLWGNPLYDWDEHRKTNYEWWISRLRYCFDLYDVVRIDHFRGFDEYYSIPYGSLDAVNGHWEKGPGLELFKRVKEVIGEKNVIAEDLGYMTESVRKLVKESGFPGMKVLEFAFDSRDTGCTSDYLPHNYEENCVAYTGTHDNQTLVSWFDSISQKDKEMARKYLCDMYTPKDELYKVFISLLLRSNAYLCIIPIQDYMGCDDKCRINHPSTIGKNWRWRIKEQELTKGLCDDILELTVRYGRS